MYIRTNTQIQVLRAKNEREESMERKKEKQEVYMIRWRIVFKVSKKRLSNPSPVFFLSPCIRVHVSAIVYFNRVCSFGK